MSNNTDTYTVKEFAEKMNRDEDAIYKWISKGWLPADRTSGITILKLRADMLREVSILTGKKFNVVWKYMKEYICELRDTFENTVERKGRGRVIKEIIQMVERRK